MSVQPRILVVDDEPAIRRLLSMALGCEGYVVFEAEDGLDALQQLQASNSLPDVMLLDLRMPRMDGPALLRTMKSDARLRSLPVIALSATPGMNDGASLGVAAYLDKPFNLNALLDTISAILERGDMLRAS
jgi:chemosensory pili system protein ChpA (sensor histidine kinase/response regulator)